MARINTSNVEIIGKRTIAVAPPKGLDYPSVPSRADKAGKVSSAYARNVVRAESRMVVRDGKVKEINPALSHENLMKGIDARNDLNKIVSEVKGHLTSFPKKYRGTNGMKRVLRTLVKEKTGGYIRASELARMMK